MSTPPAPSRLACRPRPRPRRRSGRPQTVRSSTARPRDCQVLASQTVTMATSGPRPHCNHQRSYRRRWLAVPLVRGSCLLVRGPPNGRAQTVLRFPRARPSVMRRRSRGRIGGGCPTNPPVIPSPLAGSRFVDQALRPRCQRVVRRRSRICPGPPPGRNRLRHSHPGVRRRASNRTSRHFFRTQGRASPSSFSNITVQECLLYTIGPVTRGLTDSRHFRWLTKREPAPAAQQGSQGLVRGPRAWYPARRSGFLRHTA